MTDNHAAFDTDYNFDPTLLMQKESPSYEDTSNNDNEQYTSRSPIFEHDSS